MTNQDLKHIVDDDDNVLMANLTLYKAECELCRMCNDGIDAYLTDAYDVTGFQVHYFCGDNGWVWVDGVTYADDQLSRAQQLMYEQQQAAKIIDHNGKCICTYVGTSAERQMNGVSAKRISSK